MKSLKIIRILLIAASCMTLIFAAIVSFLETDHEKKFMENFSFCTTIDGQQVELTPWEDEEEQIYYLVLPSGVSEKNIEFSVKMTEGLYRLCLDGVFYKSGDTFQFESLEGADLTLNLELLGLTGISYMSKPLKILSSENVPSLHIMVADKDDLLSETEFEKKKYIETGELLILDEEGNLTGTQTLKQFKIRGNLTATLDKKPFKLVFDEPVEMLGMTPAMKWNLLANATDGSYIRNKLVLDLANRVTDAYEPDGEFVELYLNGSYQGLYLLTEAVEAGESRLNISTEDLLLEMELDFRMEENTTYVITDRGQIFGIETERNVTQAEEEIIREFLNDIESALYSDDGISKISGKPLEEMIDLDSWADTWLIQEISGDHDTGIASQFAYMRNEQEELKLYAGPVWDFDGTMGNVNTPLYKNPAALTTSISQTRSEGNANQNRWLSAMYRNEKFRKTLEEKYELLFDKELQLIMERRIDEYTNQIRRSACLDALRWHEKRLQWEFVIPKTLSVEEEGDYRKYDTLESHITMVRDFLTAKRNFLYGLFVEHRDYCVVEIKNEASFLNQDYNQTLYYWVERGTPITNLPQYHGEGYEFKGYYDVENHRLVTDGTLIYQDCVLEGVWQQTGEK